MASRPVRSKQIDVGFDVKQGAPAICVLDEAIRGENVQLSKEEQARIREVFDAYDYDKSGKIDVTEMRELLQELKWSVDQNQLDDFLAKVFGEDATCVDLNMLTTLYKAVLAKQPSGVRKEMSLNAAASAATRRKNRITIQDLRVLEVDLRCLFKECDVDGSGYLTVPEMRRVLRASGLPDPDGDDFETAVHEHMHVADKNKDGRVCFEEFVAYRNGIVGYCYGLAARDGAAEEDFDELPQLSFVD